MHKCLQVIHQEQISQAKIPRSLCGASYVHTDVFSGSPPCNFEPVDSFVDNCFLSKREESGTAARTAVSIDKVSVATVVEAALDSLQNLSLPNTCFSHSVVYQNAALPSLSDYTVNNCVATAGLSLSASISQVSNVTYSSLFGTSLTSEVNLSRILSVDKGSVSSQGENVSHCSIGTPACAQTLSTSKTVSALNNSRSSRHQCNLLSVDLCRCLPVDTSCRSCSSLEPIISPALYALVPKATALNNQLPASYNSLCADDKWLHHSVLANNSGTQMPYVSLKTLKTSSAVNKMSSVVVSGLHPVIATQETASYNPLTSVLPVSGCTVTSSRRHPHPLPLPEVRLVELRPQTADVASLSCSDPSVLVSQCCSIAVTSANQSSVKPISQHQDRNLRSRSTLTSNISSVVPLLEAVLLPNAATAMSTMTSCKPAEFSSQAHVCAIPATDSSDHIHSTDISSQAYMCTVPTTVTSGPVHSRATSTKGASNHFRRRAVPAVAISDQVHTCTSPATGISSKVCTRTVSATSAAVSDGVHACAVPVGKFFSNARAHTVPTYSVSSPVQRGPTPTTEVSRPVLAGTSMPVCSSTVPVSVISETVVFDRVPTCTVPAVRMSGQARTSVASGAAVRLCALPSVEIHNSVYQCKVPSAEMKSSLPQPGNNVQIGDPVTASEVPWSTTTPRTRRVLPPVTRCSSSVPNSVSICSLLLCPSQVPVKPPQLLTSTPSVTQSRHISRISATSVSGRHFLDSILSLGPCPIVSSMPKDGQIQSLSLHSSTAAGRYVHRTSFSRNPVIASAHIKAPSCSIPAPVVSSIPFSPRVICSSAGSVGSFTALKSCSGNAARPTVMVYSPQLQPLLEKVALQLATPRLPVAVTRPPTVIRHVASFVGPRDLVAVPSSSSEDVLCRDNGESRCHSSKAESCLAANKAPEPVVKITSSTPVYLHLSDSRIRHQNIRKFSSKDTSISRDETHKSVVTVATCSHNCGIKRNHSVSTSASSRRTARPVIDTTSVADNCHHSNRVMSCVVDNTAVSEIDKPRDATELAVDNYQLSNRKVSGYAETVSSGSVQRKAKRVKLCSEVTTAVLYPTIIHFCRRISYFVSSTDVALPSVL